MDTFPESERLLAAKDLQFGELRNLWKSFKADVDAMEERLAQRADLESEVFTKVRVIHCALQCRQHYDKFKNNQKYRSGD